MKCARRLRHEREKGVTRLVAKAAEVPYTESIVPPTVPYVLARDLPPIRELHRKQHTSDHMSLNTASSPRKSDRLSPRLSHHCTNRQLGNLSTKRPGDGRTLKPTSPIPLVDSYVDKSVCSWRILHDASPDCPHHVR